jgi:hypothetical protein
MSDPNDVEIHRKVDRLERKLDEVKRLTDRLRNELRVLKISLEKQSRRSVRARLRDIDEGSNGVKVDARRRHSGH